MKRESFVFYGSFFDSIEQLDRSVQADILLAVVRYGLRGEIDPDLKPVANALFLSFKPQIDKNNQKYLNGINGREHGFKGGRPRKENPKITPKKPQENPKITPNVNDNVNVNEKEKKAREKKTTEFNFLFLEPEYENSFTNWLTYKTERGEPPKTQQQVEAMYRELKTLSKCSALQAEIIVNQSISNNWKGLFPVEKKEKNPQAATAYRQNVSTEDFLANRANF